MRAGGRDGQVDVYSEWQGSGWMTMSSKEISAGRMFQGCRGRGATESRPAVLLQTADAATEETRPGKTSGEH